MKIRHNNKPMCILVMGGPASGKGTFCKKLADEFGMIHLSIGDVLRKERLYQTEEGKYLDNYMKQFEQKGTLMPIDLVAQYLLQAMERCGWEKNFYLIDGFIKARAGYDCWIEKFCKLVETKFVLYLECSKEGMMWRMNNRSKDSGRLDDNEKIFNIRINTFYERTYPNILKFEEMGMVRKVNTESDEMTVYSEIKKIFFIYFPNFKYD